MADWSAACSPAVPPTDPEAELRTAAAAGDRDAFAVLYGRYRPSVYQYLIRRCGSDRHLAEDLTQDTFVRALRGLDRYRDMGRPFGAWLVTIAANLLADHWKSGWFRYQVPIGDITGDVKDDHDVDRPTMWTQPSADPAAVVAMRDARRYLAQLLALALARLTDRQQQVVLLRYVEGLSTAETARRLGLEEGAVKAATYRARQALALDPTVERLK